MPILHAYQNRSLSKMEAVVWHTKRTLLMSHVLFWILLIWSTLRIDPAYLWMPVLLILMVKWSWQHWHACFFTESENALVMSSEWSPPLNLIEKSVEQRLESDRNQWAMKVLSMLNLGTETWDLICQSLVIILLVIAFFRWSRKGYPVSI
jgi:hypothetical protein